MRMMSAKALGVAIEDIAARGKGLDKDVHECAVQALMHAQKHGDTTFLTNLFFALPRQARQKAYRYWVMSHAPIIWRKREKDGKVLEGFALKKERTDEDWKVTAAEQVTYWDFSKETSPEEVTYETFVRRLETLVKTIDKKFEELPSQGDKDRALVLKARLADMLKAPAQIIEPANEDEEAGEPGVAVG